MPPDLPSPSARWLTADDVAVDFTAAPPGPEDASALSGHRALVLVGLTGAGKSATVTGLAACGAVATVLPDRRVLTDRVILPAMTDGPGQPVTDRIERFRLTAAFRDRHPGGMGDVIRQLRFTRPLGAGWVAFDGVRGEAEVRAVAELPHALFAVLEASPEIRIARLSLRGDPFDQAALQSGDAQAGTANRSAMMDILTERRAESVLSEHALGRLAGVLATAQADASAVAAAASIIVEEARYYDPEAARAVLEQMAPDRIFVIDTARYGVDDVVGLLRARLAADG
jgi:hypothetical protein